ncbi:MAG: 4-amino-4-deoxychorismate lyase [Acidimicrobiaceae bacterium]|nr:4-amino-4-deoxychorismate lyase [Acidimicrobiaceae bacterium]MXW75896.1 4-amino-4-deoxychorismate lyase [Acidimicrobiaceae bacterium]MYA73714.1 4-amino-4-deoxychorismate lyase [Acidimicrobiaceae bacterium]MYC42995.1 4-amino-4-deoxychorismate lyase [Acidimicrobiaceae bacterium]MYD07289.1 4-amino-4-deoxychorismate lyase [Acidimicrobiaceae bacterium]
MSVQALWVNGRIVEPDQPHLRVDDHGVMVGDGVFETLAVVPNGTGVAAFGVRRHLDRLRRSAQALLFDCPYNDNELRDAIARCLDVAPGAGVVRITVTSSGGILGSRRGTGPGSTIVIAGNQPPKYAPGTAVATVPFTRNERGAMAGIKTTSYAENVLARDMARQRGASEGIFADTQGRVSEGTGSNIFWSDGRRLHTPPLDTGCLAGVTRELIMENLDVAETHLPLEDLPLVPEAFLASSTRVVQSIARIDGTDLPLVNGALTAAAATAMADLMATNIDP